MTSANPLTAQQKNLPKILAQMALGGMLGAAFAVLFVRLAGLLHVHLKQLHWSDLLALWLGTSFFGIGLIVLGRTLNRESLAEALEREVPRVPASTQEVRTVRLQAGVLILAAILLLTPVLASAWLVNDPGAAWGVYAGIIALFLLQTHWNMRIWRESDEFMRDGMTKVAAVTFAICQGLLFLRAAAEHLHLASAISSWDALTLMMAFYLLASGGLTVRHAL